MFTNWLAKRKEKRIKKYTDKTGKDPNAFVILRGNKVYNKVSTHKKAAKELPCGRCGKPPINKHDPCIANLPGVENACCGHGIEEGYIVFKNGIIIRGYFRVDNGYQGINS